MSKTKIIEFGDIKIKEYSNGSYAYIQENPRVDRNIPNEMVKKLLNIKYSRSQKMNTPISYTENIKPE